MKLTTVILLATFLTTHAAGISQTVTFSGKDVPLLKVFDAVEKQTGYVFFYNRNLLNISGPVTIAARDKPLNEFLDQLLKNQPLSFQIEDKTIILSEKKGFTIAPADRSMESVKAPAITLKGQLLTADAREPVASASVTVKQARTGTSSDASGHFSLAGVPDDATLVISSVGFATLEIPVARLVGMPNGTTLKVDDNTIERNASGEFIILLSRVATALSEAVVTALGFREAKDKLAATSSSVKAADLVRSGETGVINAMAGKAAGIQINRSSGDPGAGANIQIRGQNTITGSNQPLVIIDGIPLSNSTLGDTRSGVAQQSRLNDINPEDIESLQILKGASAAGLWGSRAANGVIIITTKQGARGNKLNVSFSSTLSFDKVNRLHSLQDTYGQGLNGVYSPTSQYSWGDKIANRSGAEDAVNLNGARFESDKGPIFYPIITKNSRETYNDERENSVFRTGRYNDNSLSLSGGNEKGNFYLGLSNLSQKGIFAGQSDYDRSSVRLNTTREFNDVIKVTAHANYIKSTSNRIPKGDNTGGLYIGMLRSSPDFDSRYWKGDYFASPTASAIPNRQRSYRNYLGASANPGYNDPLWSINELTNLTEVERFLMSAEIVIKPVSWFDFTARGGLDTYNDRRVTNNPINSVTNSGRGNYQQEFIKETESNLDVMGRAMKDLSSSISATWILGFNVNDRKYNQLGGVMNNFIMDDVPSNFTNSTYENNYPYNSETHRRTARLYSTLNLSFDDQLFLNLSGAGESGSTFGSASKSTFYYPSTDVAWIFSKLPGLRSNIFSFGKLRSSYGIVGIQPEPYRNTTPYITAAFSNWANDLSGAGYGGAYVQSDIQGDPFLKPERKTEWEIGTDLRFFRNKLSISYTYYQNKIVDLLLQISAAGSTGFQEKYTNAGKMENKGMELELNYNILNKGDFRWNVFANWNRNRNQVTDLAGTELITFTGGALSTVAHVGSAMSAFYGGAYALNADKTKALTSTGFPILSTESKIIGDPNPDWRGGFGTDLSYKNLRLHVLFETFQGGDFYEGTRGTLYNFGTHADVGKEVTLTQPLYNYAGNLIPAGTTVRGNIGDFGGGPVLLDQSYYTSIGSHTGQLAEQFVSDGSWTRIREISLAYELNSRKFREWSKLKSVSFSVTARNPVLWTKIAGIDPETNVAGVGNSRGVDYFNSPSTRSWVFSLKINY